MRGRLLLREEGGRGVALGTSRPSVALVYPNTYEVGMANFGFQQVFRLLNELGLRAERAFYEGGPVTSLESGLPVASFDMVAFSLPFEGDLPNLVSALRESGIEPLSSLRDRPLVMVGGMCALMNPCPISPFADIVVVGEAEAVLPALVPVLREMWWRPKEKLLEAASHVRGVYVPGMSSGVERVWANLDDFEPVSPIVPQDGAFGRMVLAEVGRGCGRGCRFCAAGFVYRPVRTRSAGEILDALDGYPTPTKRVGLVGAAVSDHPELEEICRKLVERGWKLATSSFRADMASSGLVEALVRGGVRTLTLAPEAGTERLRRVIRKGLSEEDLLRASRTAGRKGIKRLKLYAMIGLPSEGEEDVRALAELVREMALEFRSEGGREVGLTVQPFVPKPATPFQWAPMADERTLKGRVRILKEHLSGVSIGRVEVRGALLQGLVSLGDRRVGMAVYHHVVEGLSWREAWRKVGWDPASLHREREDPLPWDFIRHTTDGDFLRKEWEESLIGGRDDG